MSRKRLFQKDGYTEVPALSVKATKWAGTPVIVTKKPGVPGYELYTQNGKHVMSLLSNFESNFERIKYHFIQLRNKGGYDLKEILKKNRENEREISDARQKEFEDYFENDLMDRFKHLERRPVSR